MIQANELRIGNRLFKDGIIVTIDARSIFDIWDKSDKYSPIPLKPEILEKAGFETDLVTYWYEYSINGTVFYFVIAQYADGSFCYLPTGQINMRSIKIDSFHWIQNAIYLLTGTELTITL